MFDRYFYWLRRGEMVSYLVSLLAAFFIVSYFVRGSFVLELFSSFAPQAIVVFSFFFLIVVFGLLKFIYLRVVPPVYFLIVFVLLTLSLVFGIPEIYRFAYKKPVETMMMAGDGAHALRVVSFNKLYTNLDYAVIDKALSSEDPDVIGFVEITQQDSEQLKTYIQYPYRFITRCGCNTLGAENALLSKYPITFTELKNWGDDGGIFLHATIDRDGQKVHVWVVHPHSPISPEWVVLREQDFAFLGSQFALLPKNEPVIVMGDFNTPPWSATFRKFQELVGGHLYDTARGTGLHFTWGKFLMQTEIDHIFVSPGISAQHFQVLDHYGSDHKMIEADLLF